MKVTYFESDDILKIVFRDAPIQRSEAHPTGLVLDYDQNGRIVGLELATASAYLSRSKDAPLVEVCSILREEESKHEVL
ncbi:MAG: DUF2283 domain-containing protein [Capsulimonadales bacterium]|nr:DUF2283 domain-containing protein [Capsulimonadales bacterium]